MQWQTSAYSKRALPNSLGSRGVQGDELNHLHGFRLQCSTTSIGPNSEFILLSYHTLKGEIKAHIEEQWILTPGMQTSECCKGEKKVNLEFYNQ